MKRKREEDSISSYLDKKVNEYELVFHTLYSFIVFLPLDVIYYIAQYWFVLWYVPVNAFDAHREHLIPLSHQKQLSLVIRSSFRDTVLRTQALYIEFDGNGHYRISLAYHENDYLKNDLIRDEKDHTWSKEKVIEEARLRRTLSILRCTRRQYVNDYMVVHLCINDEEYEKNRDIMSAYGVILTYKPEKRSWREETSLMDNLFQFKEPTGYDPVLINDVPNAHRITNDIRNLTCRVALERPYRLCYEGKESHHMKNFIYPLVIALKHYNESHHRI